jgi:hypothetical protein
MDSHEWGRWWRLVGRTGLNNVLVHEWDPIGLGQELPWDEYDAITGPVATLLRSGAPTDQIAETLTEYRIRDMRIEPNPAADRRAAALISAWYEAAMRHAARPQARDTDS